MVCDLVADELPHASIALHVLVVVIAQPEPPITSVPTCTTVKDPQASDAVAVPKFGEAGQLIGDTTVGQVITGAVLSITLMVRLQVAVLPQSSVAVHVRVTE